MITKVEIMSCGACGCQTFSMYRKEDMLIAECNSCKSTTIIQAKANLDLGWGGKSDGILCVFPKDEA